MKKSAIIGITAALSATTYAAPLMTAPAGRTAFPAATPGGAATAPAAADATVAGAPDVSNEKSDIYIPDGTTLDLAFRLYGQLIGKTVLPDPSVPENTKIKLISLPGQKLTKEQQIEALEATFEMNNVHFEPYGRGPVEEQKFVRAVPRDKARGEGAPIVIEEDAEIPNTMTVYSVLIPFKNIPIEDAKGMIDNLKSPKCTAIYGYERIGKVLVTDTGINLNVMRRIARELDVATPINENVEVRQIVHANANDIKTAIEQIVQESQKELEKASKAQQSGQQPNRMGMTPMNGPNSSLLARRPNNPQPTPAAPSVDSLVMGASDADRGLIRGKVLITADERSNKLIIITSKANMNFFDKLIAELDVPTTPEVEVQVMRLKYADAEDVADMINDLIGNSSSSKNSNQKNQNQAARNGTGGNLTRNTTTQPAAARAPANQRSGESKAGELSKDNCTVLADKRINGLVIMAHKDVWPTVKGIVEKMDVKLSQVLIETAIVEVTLGDELKTGIDWVQRGRERVTTQRQRTDAHGPLYYKIGDDGEPTSELTHSKNDFPVMESVTSLFRDGFVNNGNYALGGGGGTGASVLNTMMNVGTNVVNGAFFGGANPIGSGINYLLKSDKLNLAAVIQASKDDSRSKYVASPVVMTVDNKEATIEATQMRYLLKGYTYSGSTYNGTTVPDYEQKEIGLTIKVTPKINPNGTVMLKVEEEYSQVGANQSIQANVGGTTTSSVSVPTTITRKMSADILLDNRQTVVLGGLTETSESESETGIPILKDIPWIGKWLFSSTTKSEDRKELLVFMTPYVLDDAESAQAEALRRKNALSDTRPWMNGGGWSASELADPVSQKELLRRLKDEADKRDEDRANKLAIEKWTLERAKELTRMTEAERKFWLDQHRESLKDDAAKEAFDQQVAACSAEQLEQLVESIRAARINAAQEKVEAADPAKKERE